MSELVLRQCRIEAQFIWKVQSHTCGILSSISEDSSTRKWLHSPVMNSQYMNNRDVQQGQTSDVVPAAKLRYMRVYRDKNENEIPVEYTKTYRQCVQIKVRRNPPPVENKLEDNHTTERLTDALAVMTRRNNYKHRSGFIHKRQVNAHTESTYLCHADVSQT